MKSQSDFQSARQPQSAASSPGPTFTVPELSGTESYKSIDGDLGESAPHAKRRRLKHALDDCTYTGMQDSSQRLNGVSATSSIGCRRPERLRVHESAEIEQVTSHENLRCGVDASATEFTAVDFEDHPVNRHPAGIAIWILQKIDAARRGRAPSASSTTPPSLVGPVAVETEPSSESKDILNTFGEANSTSRPHVWGERGGKPQLENWAKSKYRLKE